MSKKPFKSQASSARAGGAGLGGTTFGAISQSSAFGSTQASALSYVQEAVDYAGFGDGHTVVIFKNLSKKDGTTKAKALEDLQTSLDAGAEVEDAVVEAWVKLYPRLSIDNNRRVRQLSHTVNGQLCAKCGKRIVRLLPKLVGPWFAGQNDPDRLSAKAAQTALALVFPSTEKIQGLRRTFQGSILEFSRDAVLKETIQTLSDERTVSRDDAEATFARVVASNLTVVASLLRELPNEELKKHASVYAELFEEEKLWAFAYHDEVTVRKALHNLIQTALKQYPTLIQDNLSYVSTAYLYKGLASNQTGSSLDFVQTLLSITNAFPSVWTTSYTNKKSVWSRFKAFLKNGSQSGVAAFWDESQELLKIIPPEIWPASSEDVRSILLSTRDGITKKDERLNTVSAWTTYFVLIDILISPLTTDDATKVANDCILPLIKQYLSPSSDLSDWNIYGNKSTQLVARATSLPGASLVVDDEWDKQATQIAEMVKLSQPEKSKDFEKSQNAVAAYGERWSVLQREIFATQPGPSQETVNKLALADTALISECCNVLRSREGKPFGAAAIIESLLRNCYNTLSTYSSITSLIDDLAQEYIPSWVHTPSRRYLIQSLYAASSRDVFAKVFEETLRVAFAAEDASSSVTALINDLFPANTPAQAKTIARVQPDFQKFAQSLIRKNPKNTDIQLLAKVMQLGVLSDESTDLILSGLVEQLDMDESSGRAGLTHLATIAETNEAVLRDFMAKPGSKGEQLLPRILRLEHSSDDETSESATTLSSKLSSVMGKATSEAKYSMILQNLEKPSSNTLSIDTISDLARRVLETKDEPGAALELLPDLTSWKTTIAAAMRLPAISLAVTSPLGGAIQLAENFSKSHRPTAVDAEGLSQAIRNGIYVSRMLTNRDVVESLISDVEKEANIYILMYLTTLLTEDNLSVTGSNALWVPHRTSELEPLLFDFTSEANVNINSYLAKMKPEPGLPMYDAMCQTLHSFRHDEQVSWPTDYYFELASAKLHANLFELHGHSSQQTKASEVTLREKRASKDVLSIVAYLIGHEQPLSSSSFSTRYCNELVADVTDLKLDESNSEQKGLRQLTILNAIFDSQENALDSIAKQRLVFLSKRLIKALDEAPSVALIVETCKALSHSVYGMYDMYGEHWAQMLSHLIKFWETLSVAGEDNDAVDDERVLLMHASLKLFNSLKKLAASEEPNEDLVDGLKAESKQIGTSLIKLLISEARASDENHQPLAITHGLLYRQIKHLPSYPIEHMTDLLSILYAPSNSVQEAAFHILHQHIPAIQEQISFDAALDDKKASLPDELLSLVTEAPTLDAIADLSFDRRMPLSLQGYLYSWRLLFDHFTNSSYRVKNDYIDQLKDGSYLSGLLDFTFEFLGHSNGRPVDVSKFDMQNYTPDVEPSPEKDVQWLLVHLYYLALTYLPSSVKAHFLDIRSRQTSLAVESWTAKFISPLIIGNALENVAAWAESSVKEDAEYEKMSIKVGTKSREINVSYVVDEQTMAIKVILPEAYPLASAQVVSVQRVAVREEKWQSWLRNCQGVIIFSNGSITDGLAAWRKNVTGALKGQTECAICYSIISADKQLPTKKCPTCKNLFHSSCLFKWFKTSNASTCPLCRNPFNFN